jgi:hypothetical protein
VDPVQREEGAFGDEPDSVADVIALPQLERLPPNPDFPDSSPGFTQDNRSARLEALELVRAAVELADRIERDAHETAKDRLTRTEEEVRLRRLSLDERETSLDHFKRELEAAQHELTRMREGLDTQRHETAEALREAQARQATADEQAASTIAAATERAEALQNEARAEADGILAGARSEAEAMVAAARSDAQGATESVRAEAEAALVNARTEAEELLARASAEAAQLAESARGAADELLAQAGVEARGISDVARREAEQMLAAANAGGAAPDPQLEPETAQREPEATTQAEAPAEPEPAGGFTPPPTSLEDLAAASRPTKFSMGGRFRGK